MDMQAAARTPRLAATDDSPIADHIRLDLMSGRSGGADLKTDVRNALLDKANERAVSLAASGVGIHAWNGRDSLGDALDSVVDLAGYLRQGMVEWGAVDEGEIVDALTSAYLAAMRIAAGLAELDSSLLGYPVKPGACTPA